MDSGKKAIFYQMFSDTFEVVATNAKHIEVGFLTNRRITISTINGSFIGSIFVLETSTNICCSPIHRPKLRHQENVLLSFG
jgi:hypothetical protein